MAGSRAACCWRRWRRATPLATLSQYLFGSLATVAVGDVVVLAVAALLSFAVLAVFDRELFLVSLDPDLAHVQGVKVRAISLLLSVLTAVTVVIGMRTVGLLLVSAIMIVPIAAAQQFTRSFAATAVGGVAVGCSPRSPDWSRRSGSICPRSRHRAAGPGGLRGRSGDRPTAEGRRLMAPPPDARTTRQRRAIWEAVAAADGFVSAQQLHARLREQGDRIGLATVYRTLGRMAAAGELDALLGADGETVYRKCSDGHHHHLVCRECGRTVEVSGSAVESWAGRIAEQEGFSAVSHTVELTGICSSCAGRGARWDRDHPPAEPGDVDDIVAMIRELAEYEQGRGRTGHIGADPRHVVHRFRHPSGSPAASCLVVADGDSIAGMALWFLNFSTWRGRHGVYLEDLFVRPQYRGRGYGKALLVALARICVDHDYGRLEWSVLDWNQPAIDFYRSQGAVAMDEWTVYRVSGRS